MYTFAPRPIAPPASQRAPDLSGIGTAPAAGAVQARLDATLNRSARVAFAQRLGETLNQSRRSTLQAHFVHLLGHRARSPGAAASAADAAPIQRQVQINPEVVVKDRNVAVQWHGLLDYADTYTMINGKRIPPTANKVGLIKSPDFSFIPDNEQYRLQMMVPTQVVTPLLELPAIPQSGRWELRDVEVGRIDALVDLFGGKIPERAELEKSQLCTLIVEPDGNLADKIESHERHHLKDNLDAVNEILVPWDEALQDSKDMADEIKGNSPLEIPYEEFVPKETAQAIADRLVARIKELGEAYHLTEQGQSPVMTANTLDKSQKPWQYRIRLKLEKT